MLYEYLTERYKENEPIFVSDVELPVSDTNLRQMFKNLCDEGIIRRFDTGVYYIPKVSRLKGGVPLAADIVAKYKYIYRNGRVDGYYSGYTFANQIGVTTQVPYVIEIVSNNASARVRDVNLAGRRIRLRKARTKITDENYRMLQFLDLVKDIDLYSDEESNDVSERLRKYILDEGFTEKEVKKYIGDYPDKIYRKMFEMGLFNVLARG